MSVFDILCPCHAQLSQTGHILHLGPTLAKVLGDVPALPVRFLEMFELRRPHSAASMRVLFALAGQKLTFRLRSADRTKGGSGAFAGRAGRGGKFFFWHRHSKCGSAPQPDP